MTTTDPAVLAAAAKVQANIAAAQKTLRNNKAGAADLEQAQINLEALMVLVPPPVATMTLSDLVATPLTSIGDASVTVNCTSDIINVTLTMDTTDEADATPVAGIATWTVTGLSTGTHTVAVQGWNVPSGDPQHVVGLSTPVLTTTVTIAAAPPPPPADTALFFPPTDFFNAPIVSDPVIDPNSASWVALIETSSSSDGAALYTDEDAWPIYYATNSDPQVTVNASDGKTATFNLPADVVAQASSDGHALIVNTDTLVETELYQGVFDGDSVSASGIFQFNVSTVDGNSRDELHGYEASARSCGMSCVGGLVMESEVLAGVIPHALCSTVPFDSSVVRYPAWNSDGGYSGGVPMGTRWQLDPAYDISGLSAEVQIFAKALQVYGCYVTDSTSPPLAFQGERATSNNPNYPSGSNIDLSSLPWSEMRFLAAWDGS